MLLLGIGSRLISAGQTIVEVSPMIWGSVGGINAKQLYRIDRLQYALNLRPAADAQQDLAARTNKR